MPYKEVIPNWFKEPKKGTLNQYYTRDEVALNCYNSLLSIAKKYNVNIEDYTFLEPSAGNGAFFKILPKDRRVGIDLAPQHKDITKINFFDWEPKNDTKYITIGNPPFGKRGWQALNFLNKASKFSEIVGFILPMSFASIARCDIKKKVIGLKLLHSEDLPTNIFYFGQKNYSLATVWQVWGKFEPPKKAPLEWNNQALIFSVNGRRPCNFNKIINCTFFIDEGFFNKPIITSNVQKVKYGRGLGVKASKDVLKYLKTIDWTKYSTRATNESRHIGINHIKKAIVDGGFKKTFTYINYQTKLSI